jgi:cyclopropane-fatty-acyl-phospholipid synthase
METINSSILSSYKTSLYRQIVFSIFERFQKGRIKLRLPEGDTVEMGDGQGVECQLDITNEKFFKHVVLNGDIGFGESYVMNYWDSPSVSRVIQWVVLNIESVPGASGGDKGSIGFNLLNSVFRLKHKFKANTYEGARRNISYHYDLSNNFFSLFLDPSMTYSSAYFSDPNLSLELAQYEKYKMMAESLEINSSDHVLEIGCGWGGFATYVAKNYGCRVTGITISKEQLKYAQERIKREGLEHLIELKFCDYRDLTGQYDKVASVEMIEAVGHEFFKSYFSKIHQVLKPSGIACIQAITSPDARYEQFKNGTDWIQTYIFPGSLLPSIGEINRIINKHTDMHLLNLKDFGIHYSKTLHLWFERFNQNFEEIKKLGFDEEFKRKWNYYLQYCEAAFYMRNISVVQLTYVRPNNLKLRREFTF